MSHSKTSFSQATPVGSQAFYTVSPEDQPKSSIFDQNPNVKAPSGSISQEFPLKRELLPGINAGAVGTTAGAQGGALLPLRTPSFL